MPITRFRIIDDQLIEHFDLDEDNGTIKVKYRIPITNILTGEEKLEQIFYTPHNDFFKPKQRDNNGKKENN